jgi:hypothetical protein
MFWVKKKELVYCAVRAEFFKMMFILMLSSMGGAVVQMVSQRDLEDETGFDPGSVHVGFVVTKFHRFFSG